MNKIIARLILFTEPTVKWADRLSYAYNVVINFAPIVFIMKITNWWFSENQQFGNFMCISLVLNMIVGVVFHLKYGTFSFWQFLKKNVEIIFIVVVSYIMLETLRYTAGDNFAGEVFRITIQIITLLYPTSKVLKNFYIMTDGKYPPKFFMDKLYNFEKNGDLKDFFNKKQIDNE